MVSSLGTELRDLRLCVRWDAFYRADEENKRYMGELRPFGRSGAGALLGSVLGYGDKRENGINAGMKRCRLIWSGGCCSSSVLLDIIDVLYR